MLGKTRGYSVKPTGRAGLVYREEDRSVHVFSELLAGGDFDIVVYLSQVKRWDPPHASEEVTEEERARMRERIPKALKVHVEWA